MLDTQQRTSVEENEDPLAPARGFLFALALSIPLWIILGLMAYLYFWNG